MDNWTRTGGRTLSATLASGLQPHFYLHMKPDDGPAVRFAQDRLRRTDNSPVAGLTNFSMATVFRLNGGGVGSQSQWSDNTGLVDAEQRLITADWGTAVTASGRIGWGIGSPDKTLYTPTLLDGNIHVAAYTWGGGEQAIFLDNQYTTDSTGASMVPRNNAGLAFGRILTEANQSLIGDLMEVRFYDSKLTGQEATNLVTELLNLHVNTFNPIIYTFTASTDQILIKFPRHPDVECNQRHLR